MVSCIFIEFWFLPSCSIIKLTFSCFLYINTEIYFLSCLGPFIGKFISGTLKKEEQMDLSAREG